MAFGDFSDLPKRTVSDKLLRDKAFNIDKNSEYDGYQRGLASMVYKYFYKKTASLTDKSATGTAVKNKIMSNQIVAEKNTQTNYWKIWRAKSTLVCYRQYLGC